MDLDAGPVIRAFYALAERRFNSQPNVGPQGWPRCQLLSLDASHRLNQGFRPCFALMLANTRRSRIPPADRSPAPRGLVRLFLTWGAENVLEASTIFGFLTRLRNNGMSRLRAKSHIGSSSANQAAAIVTLLPRRTFAVG